MLHIQEEILAHCGVLQLSGRLDFYGETAFKDALKKMEQAGVKHLILDLSAIPAIGSTTLGVLVATQKRLSGLSKSICLVIDHGNATGQVMSQTSLQALIPNFPSIKEAISSLTSSVQQP